MNSKVMKDRDLALASAPLVPTSRMKPTPVSTRRHVTAKVNSFIMRNVLMTVNQRQTPRRSSTLMENAFHNALSSTTPTKASQIVSKAAHKITSPMMSIKPALMKQNVYFLLNTSTRLNVSLIARQQQLRHKNTPTKGNALSNALRTTS
ncbi:MAG: hypothetical protein QF535_13810, partial [Anaerolineales bacterium]|nr:hypothetical protein [Anaerolineales bacterium]